MKQFFEFFGEPLEFGSDNRREFINSSVSEFLNEKNIKLIKGLLYSPIGVTVLLNISIQLLGMLYYQYF